MISQPIKEESSKKREKRLKNIIGNNFYQKRPATSCEPVIGQTFDEKDEEKDDEEKNTGLFKNNTEIVSNNNNIKMNDDKFKVPKAISKKNKIEDDDEILCLKTPSRRKSEIKPKNVRNSSVDPKKKKTMSFLNMITQMNRPILKKK